MRCQVIAVLWQKLCLELSPPGCVSAIVLWLHSYCPFMESLSCEGQIKFLKCLDKGEEQETVVEVIGRKIFVSYNKTLLNNSWNCSTREDA